MDVRREAHRLCPPVEDALETPMAAQPAALSSLLASRAAGQAVQPGEKLGGRLDRPREGRQGGSGGGRMSDMLLEDIKLSVRVAIVLGREGRDWSETPTVFHGSYSVSFR